MKNIHIWGEAAASKDATCQDRYGFWVAQGTQGTKPLHPTTMHDFPFWKIMSNGSWITETNFRDVFFHDFKKQQLTCDKTKTQYAIGLNPSSSDFIQPQLFYGATFDNVADDALAYIKSPDAKWAKNDDEKKKGKVDQCGEFPCSGPQNTMIKFKSTKFSGKVRPLFSAKDFQIVANTSTDTVVYDTCVKKDAWNAQYCTNPKINVLIFESQDSDKFDRSAQPVMITNLNLNQKNSTKVFKNKLNAFMDHQWNGAYTSQKRLQRFPTQMQVDNDYQIAFTGTTPKSLRFKLHDSAGTGSKLRILYADVGAYDVYKFAKKIEPNKWNDKEGGQEQISKKKGCGENRMVGGKNGTYLEIFIAPGIGCSLTISPRDALVVSIRMTWTLDQFYSDGGVDKFADRVSAALGIPKFRVKVVAVYKGSVNVIFTITASPTAFKPKESLAEIQTSLTKVLSDKKGTKLGAPILESKIKMFEAVVPKKVVVVAPPPPKKVEPVIEESGAEVLAMRTVMSIAIAAMIII